MASHGSRDAFSLDFVLCYVYSGSVSSENEDLVPGRGKLRGLTQVFPAPGDKTKISGSCLER